MHIKAARSAEPGSKSLKGSTKTYILSRLHKAALYAEHLVKVLKEHAVLNSSNDDVLEARAYYIGIRGAADFEKQSWEKSLQQYSEARLIYTTLAAFNSSRREDLFRDLLSTTVDPSIRYAAYRLKLPRTTSIDAIVTRYVAKSDNEYIDEVLEKNPEALDDPTSSKKRAKEGQIENAPQTIQWRSRKVNIGDASTAQALGAVSAAEASLATFLLSHADAAPQAKAAAYDQVLIASQDAVDATKTAIDELSAEGVPQDDRQMQSLQIARTAVNYALIGWRIGRNRILCGSQDGAYFETEILRAPKNGKEDSKMKKSHNESTGHKIKRLKERVVLYDASLQSLDAVTELPGVAADEEFSKELLAQRAYFSALRCLAVARSHALLSNTKEALALLSRASDLSSKALSHSSLAPSPSSKPPNIEVSHFQANSLDELLKSLVIRYRALVELHNIHSASIAAATKSTLLPPLVERLDAYPAGEVDLVKLVKYPPKLEPVPVKPIFLDVAYNYIDYPGRTRKASSKAVNGIAGSGVDKEEKHENKKGWFGFGR